MARSFKPHLAPLPHHALLGLKALLVPFSRGHCRRCPLRHQLPFAVEMTLPPLPFAAFVKLADAADLIEQISHECALAESR